MRCGNPGATLPARRPRRGRLRLQIDEGRPPWEIHVTTGSSQQAPAAAVARRTPRQRVLRLIESLPFRVATMLLILIDLVFVVLDLLRPEPAYTYLALVVVCLFVCEIAFRIFGLGPENFFGNWMFALDFAVIAVTFVATVVFLAVTEVTQTAKLGKLMLVLRLPRLLVLLRVFPAEFENIAKALRRLVSSNRTRYTCHKEGFDLDLCYITEKVIAMSYPGTGLMSVYRNPMKEVARFLDLKHPGSYKVYNLCKEGSYDSSHFHGRVERFHIDDHNVPRLSDMLKFAASVREWLALSDSNVIVVHCKGGKGRTGTLICTYMVDAGIYESAKKCLEVFGSKRTDYQSGREYQGVDTPSQSRYVGFFEFVKKQLNYRPPPNVPLVPRRIVLHGIVSIGNGDGSDFFLEIFESGRRVGDADVGQQRNCSAEFSRDAGAVTVTLRNPPTVVNDVKFRFFSRNKSVPTGYENCAFYFCFHTFFVQNRRLRLDRTQLDNASKDITWRVWHQSFAVEVQFDSPG